VELTEAISRRRMVRAFSDRPIDPSIVTELCALALRAPAAGRTDGVDLVVCTTESARDLFWSHASTRTWRESDEQAPGLLAAPMIVIVVSEPAAYSARYSEPDKARSVLGGLDAQQWPVPFWTVDASFVSMLLLLAATDHDLGALFFHVHGDHAALLESYGVPAGHEILGALAIGYPASPVPSATGRAARGRSVERVVHYDHW
jgi:nitroreductase